jgi:hypothetical protein
MMMSCSESQLCGTKLGKGANVECSENAVLRNDYMGMTTDFALICSSDHRFQKRCVMIS